MGTFITYETLYEQSKELVESLIKNGLLDKFSNGRLFEYQKEVKKLAEEWRRNKKSGLKDEVEFGGLQVLALKELRELSEAIGSVTEVFKELPKVSQDILRSKITNILSGATYSFNEMGNTEARNLLFELRLASKLIEAGYKVLFYENPDLSVETKGRRYAIECKRITGISPRTIQANIETAAEQLVSHKEYYYAGIVALDVTAIYDKRTDILISHSRKEAGTGVLDDMGKLLQNAYQRHEKLRRYCHGHIVALLYNYSGSYAVREENDVGWVQGTGVLVFDKENPNKARLFNKDFKDYRNGIGSGEFR